jgi:tetratricopeptide (TPR) repeat protein
MDEQLLRSIVKFSKKIAKDPYAKLYAPLGDGYRQVGLLDDAIDACLIGLELYPRYLTCNEVLGRVYLRQTKFEAAKAELEKVHAVIGDNLELCKPLVKVYAKAGEPGKAAAMLDWIVTKDPFDFEMRNIRLQLRREKDTAHARTEAIGRGEDPDAVDIFELAERTSVVDIKSIVEDEADIDYDRKAHERATDTALDSLEGIEDEIDAQADRIMAEAAPVAAASAKKRTKKDKKLRREIISASVEELSAAAIIAQTELELSLLDEAAIICRRLLDQEPGDPEIKDLAAKFDRRIEAKEAELDKLENQNLAHGL